MIAETAEGLSKDVREEMLGENTLPYIEEISENRGKITYALMQKAT